VFLTLPGMSGKLLGLSGWLLNKVADQPLRLELSMKAIGGYMGMRITEID
jgi:hypothetical protein